MAASHFFIGLSAGIALLAVPVLTLTPGSSVPQHVVDWIAGPPPQPARTQDAAVNRPLHGYQPGDPTPAAETAPTIQALAKPTRPPTPAPTQQAVAVNQPPMDSLRWAGTGVIRSGGVPVYVRRVAGADSPRDAQIADGSPVLVSTSPPLQVGSQQWRAIRGLNGVVGWVPREQLVVDGEAPPPEVLAAPTAQQPALARTQAAPAPQQAAAVQAQATPGLQLATPTAVAAVRASIGGTDGSGVVLRNSPNDLDRTPRGLMDGTSVTVLEVSGLDWVHVRADNGLVGWVPARYVAR